MFGHASSTLNKKRRRIRVNGMGIIYTHSSLLEKKFVRVKKRASRGSESRVAYMRRRRMRG